MTNKEMIKKMRDNAELAWAAYGYFHLADKNYKPHKLDKDGRKLKQFRETKEKEDIYPTLQDILNINYKSIFESDMSPTQAQNFFKHYDLLIHQPNTSSGFLATLFQDKESKEFILAMRGTRE